MSAHEDGSGVQEEKLQRPASQLPLPGQSGAPFFEGEDVEEFLTDWEQLADTCGLSKRDKVKMVPGYVKWSLRHTVRMLGAYASGAWEWDDFRQQMANEFIGQSMVSVVHELQNYCSTEHEDIVTYTRKFNSLSTKVEDEEMTEREVCRLYLGGLPERVRLKILESIPFDEVRTLKPVTELMGMA